jgi:hypothetical protein
MDNQSRRPGLVRVKTVRGEAYQVGGWKLAPVARIVSMGRARARIGQSDISGWGFGFARIAPRAVVVETDDGEHTVHITDWTARAVWVALGATALAALLVASVRWTIGRRS